MAAPAPYSKLSPAQQKIALAKWHARQDAKTPLTPAQQQKAALAQVVAPGLTQGDLNKMVGADTQMRYGQQEADLRAQPARINAAFAAYKNAIGQAANQLTGSGPQLGGSYGNSVQGVTNLASGLDKLSKDQWAGQQAAMQADAAQRGATVDPGLADVAHNASNVRNMLTGSFGAQLLAQGTNTRQQYADRGVNAEQQRGETLGQARTNLNNLLAQKGTFKTSDAQTIVANTSKNALNNALAASTIGQRDASVASANASTGLTQAKTAFLKRYGRLPGTTDPNSPSSQLDTARLSYFQKHGYFPPTGPPKPKKSTTTKPASGPGSLSSATEQKRLSQIRKIGQYYRVGVTSRQKQLDGTYKSVTIAKPGDTKAITAWLQQQGVDPLAITIGQDLYTNNGKLSRHGVNAAHRYGVHVGGNFGIAPPPATGVGAVPGVGQVGG